MCLGNNTGINNGSANDQQMLKKTIHQDQQIQTEEEKHLNGSKEGIQIVKREMEEIGYNMVVGRGDFRKEDV